MTARLTPDERAHYAWLAGDYGPEQMLEHARGNVEPDALDWLEDHGMYTAHDLDQLQDQRDDAREEADDLRIDLGNVSDELTAVRAELESTKADL